LKYSLCIGAYAEKDIIYHLQKVKEHDFQGLEYYCWWELPDIKALAKQQQQIGVGISATCTKFISLVDIGLRDQYIEGLRQTIEACRILNIQSIISQTGNELANIPRTVQLKTMVDTLKLCVPMLEKAGLVLELEPLNTLVDHQGHFLVRSDEAAAVIDQVDSPHVKLVFDVYHQQISEGNVIRNATYYVDRINHYHIADNPGRQEPGTGELNYANILRAIQATGFTGYIGLECQYTKDTDIAINEFKAAILSQLNVCK
jgi:hydroxypyruvate isomerase